MARFTEKPDLARAQEYVAGGQHAWNSGMFVLRADAFRREAEAHMPDILAAAEKVPVLAAERDAERKAWARLVTAERAFAAETARFVETGERNDLVIEAECEVENARAALRLKTEASSPSAKPMRSVSPPTCAVEYQMSASSRAKTIWRGCAGAGPRLMVMMSYGNEPSPMTPSARVLTGTPKMPAKLRAAR